MLLITGYVLLGCLGWALGFIYLVWTVRNLPRLSRLAVKSGPLAQWPGLSVVIPACNEGQYIESALNSLLAQNYPRLEIVVVDDRSTDDTGEIIDRVAGRDARVRPVHIQSLPSGWLGKVHALHQGMKQASGEWLLFTDADIHYAPGSLQKAINAAVKAEVDQLSLLPRVTTRSFWLGVAVRSFGLLFLYSTRAAQAHKTDNEYFIGVGAFNLVRREAFARTPGFEWIKLEPGDDAALGMMIKQAGGKICFAMAEEELSLDWYSSIGAMFKGLEKNLFGAGAHYQWWRVLAQILAAWGLVMAPLTGLLVGLNYGQALVLIIAVLTIALHLGFALVLAQKNIRDFVYLLLFPAGLLLINAMMIRAAYRCLRNDGIDWRGTHYPLAQLRAGQRIRF